MIGIHWIVIIVFLIVGIITIKMNHLRHRIFIIILLLIGLFLYSTMVLVSKQNDIDLSSSNGIFHAIRVYTGWLANGYQNVKTLTGKVIDMDWISSNKTFFKDKK